MRNALCCIGVLAVAACAFAQTGGIQGTVTDDAGQLLTGAYVIATPLGSAGGISSTTQSKSDGSFSLAQLSPGDYMLCVQVPHSRYLDSCRWFSPVVVRVVGGQVSANNSLHVARGSIVRVRLNDAGKHLANGEGEVLLGIVASSLFHPLRLAASDASGRTFDIAIPLNASLRLAVTSDRLQLQDVNGNALSAISNSFPILFPILQVPGAQDLTLTFNITGKRP